MNSRIAFTAGSNGPAGPNQLKYALTDQARMSRVLSSRFCGFEVHQTNPGTTVTELRQGIFEAAERCRPGDTLVVSFAGHAIVDGDEFFLFWHDSHPSRLLQTALPGRDVFMALNRSRATSKLLILDCCRAGAVLGDGFRSEPGTSLQEVSKAASSFHMLLASDRLEEAREIKSLGGGFLTVKFCDALERFVDADNDGQTSLSDAVDWIRAEAEHHNRWVNQHKDSLYPEEVPIPLVMGKERGPLILTTRPSWEPWNFNIGSVQMTLLPVYGELPFHALAISKHPITNSQYREFMSDMGGASSELEPDGYAYDAQNMTWEKRFKPQRDRLFQADDLPVVCVDYWRALRYCAWASNKYGWRADGRTVSDHVELSSRPDPISLPTPEEWSFAAYGDFQPHSPLRGGRGLLPTPVRRQPEMHQMTESPAPVDRTGARTNSLGVSDMFGNVWEWCLGTSIANVASVAMRGTEELHSPRTVELRGGGFLDDAAQVSPYIRASELKDGLNTSHTDLGFRIATYVRVASLPEQVQQLFLYYKIGLPWDNRRSRRLPTGQLRGSNVTC
jgi:formylglycine-generating enzyme required for sulfatase activity